MGHRFPCILFGKQAKPKAFVAQKLFYVFFVCACLSQVIADSTGMALHAAKSECALSLHSCNAFDCFLRFVSLKKNNFLAIPLHPLFGTSTPGGDAATGLETSRFIQICEPGC